MRTSRSSVALLLPWLCALGCALNHPSFVNPPDARVDATSELPAADAPATDVSDASDISDASDASDVSDVSDALDVADVSDALDVADVRDAGDVVDVLDATDVTDASDALDVADVRDASDVADAPDVTDAPVDTGPMCTALETLCDGVCANLTTSTANCGRCGNACTSPETCLGGACACPGGTRACDGTCVDLLLNPNHCGRCGNACTSPQACVDGACVCPGGRTLCGTTCVTTATDINNCGACGNVCRGGSTCVAGQCTCPSPLAYCGSSCVSLVSDRANCGACTNACGATSACVSGQCQTALTCASGTGDCNGMAGDGCEADLGASVQHCGRCGSACLAGYRCDSGVCARARSCREIHRLWPSLPSGMYTITPASTERNVWCDMTTADGGWTVIYLWPGMVRPMSPDYTVNDLAIPGAATEALIAYRDGSNAITDPAWARFPIPAEWQTASPFRARNRDVSVVVTQATGASTARTLRFGNAEFGNDCNSNWDTRATGGRICINGTNAPFFCEFQSSSYDDRCPNSNQRWDSAGCTMSRRFSIAVR